MAAPETLESSALVAVSFPHPSAERLEVATVRSRRHRCVRFFNTANELLECLAMPPQVRAQQAASRATASAGRQRRLGDAIPAGLTQTAYSPFVARRPRRAAGETHWRQRLSNRLMHSLLVACPNGAPPVVTTELPSLALTTVETIHRSPLDFIT